MKCIGSELFLVGYIIKNLEITPCLFLFFLFFTPKLGIGVVFCLNLHQIWREMK